MSRLYAHEFCTAVGVARAPCPAIPADVPAEILLGELGLMAFDARAYMHTQVWDAIMARPAAALPRLAWLELVNACEVLPGGPPMYTLAARVKEIRL